LTPSVLKSIDSAIQTDPGSGGPWVSVATGSLASYTVTAQSVDGDTYSINQTNGNIFRTCTPPSGINFECDNGVW
jgi:hypothetical protein